MKTTVPLLFALSLAPAAAVLADAPVAAPTAPLVLTREALPQIEPAAQAVLDKVVAAYAALDKFSTHFESTVTNGDKVTTYAGNISFSRGEDKGKLDYTVNKDRSIVVADGQKLWMQLPVEPVSYRVSEMRPKSAMAVVTSRLNTFTNFPIFNLMMGADLTKAGYAWESISLKPGNVLDLLGHTGNAHHVVHVTVDPTDGLIRKIDATRIFNDQNLKTVSTFSDVKTAPVFGADAFNYVPAAGVKEFVQPPAYDPKLVVGAEPYALTGADMDGNTADWSKYKGKVVLLDFWATWCGPCMGELPNVLKNFEAYHPKGFEIIGVSLDDDKAALLKTIKLKGMNYPNLFDGQGWKNVNAKAYGVQAIPFSLLIGKDGKIAAVNPRGEMLEPAIQKALAQP